MTTGSLYTFRAAGTSARGWTMIELLVVITIITLLASISVPIYRMFSQNDLRDGARTIYTMLRAARIYAMTYNVEAAVVYVLDDESLGNLVLRDTISDMNVRAIRAATIMYRLPDESATTLQQGLPPAGVMRSSPLYMYDDSNKPNPVDIVAEDVNWHMVGTFTYAPRVGGEFVSLPQGYAILLNDVPNQWTEPLTPSAALGNSVYGFDANARAHDGYLYHYNRLMEMKAWNEGGNRFEPLLERIGMMPVHAHAGGIDREPDHGPFIFDPSLTRPVMAHVFTPRGSLKTRHQSAERYRILVAPDPWQLPEDRLIGYPDGPFRLVGIPIEIHRATGRVRMGS